jgi:phi13 family phage major tail protein
MSEVKINVEDVHLAEITESPDGALIFGVPEYIPGAMEIGRTPQLSTGQLYGDGKVRHSISRKNSYQITINQNKLPSKWRRYMEGTKVNNGVESGTSKDEPKPFAIGWAVEKTGGKRELIWFLYCKAEPIQETVRQSEDSTNYSTDSVTITALEHDSLDRFYTFIDTEDEEIKPEMVENFFKQVQTTDAISAPPIPPEG